MGRKKPAVKAVKVKDIGTKMNPKGGMTEPNRAAQLAAPQIATSMRDAVNSKLNN